MTQDEALAALFTGHADRMSRIRSGTIERCQVLTNTMVESVKSETEIKRTALNRLKEAAIKPTQAS